MIPVIEETPAVSHVSEATGAAVRVRVVSEKEQRLLATTETVAELVVERVPVNRFVDQRSGPREEDGVVVVPVFETVAVLETRLLLREELRIVRRRREVPRETEVVLHKERAIVERRDSAAGEWREEEAAPPESE